ncbi:TetR/AcrR family transcriptional regulator [Streptomyces goshikiensis]|uniref:TetR/AcrR family transcriptional regulator n=1 Tax=Streptomyces goshikiensis TaxID=1942 RepID=UPI0022F4006D|nr:TetR/AcrR family transcriptional regulator [Streptomyces goshikiensis]WBY19932.1 helix-turn-helix domain containing protein [Streptomyces goshikiensis]
MTVEKTPGERPVPVRRDARRNRDLLIAAAREAFAAQGLDAPLDDIARRAGVGNATLYRHFPGRAALVDAVFEGALADTVSAGEGARAAEDAWAGLTGYLATVFEGLAADRGTNDLMTTGLEGVRALDAVHAHNHETVELLLSRAQRQGTVRADVITEDLLLALAVLGRAVPALTATAPDGWRRSLALLLDGLRAAGPAAALPGPAPSPASLAGVLRALGPHRR